jgi:prolyl-tRNA synthetase
MGGSGSQEFMVYTEAGEDLIASSASGYAANLEKATSTLAPVVDLEPVGTGLPELVSTPGKASIADVTAFFGIHASQDIKCVAFMGTTTQSSSAPPSTTVSSPAKVGSPELRPIVAFLRGDHQVNETKLMALTGVAELRPMVAEELALHIGGPAGFLGPVGIAEVMTQGSLNGLNSGKAIEKLKGVLREDGSALKTIVVMDLGLAGRKNLVAGANQLDFHFRNVTPGRDFTPTLTADIRNILEGELDPIGGQPLRLGKAVEIGHIFKLGRKYSSSMHATVLNRDGKEVVPTMGSYGIGVERILTAAIETSAASFSLLSSRSAAEGSASPPATAEQFALPPSIAPFEVVVTITNVKDPALVEAGEKLAAELSAAGLDVLLDDRDERAGVKFKDADLIGVPFRIAIGRSLAEGKVEFLNRLTNQTAEIPVSEVQSALRPLLR